MPVLSRRIAPVLLILLLLLSGQVAAVSKGMATAAETSDCGSMDMAMDKDADPRSSMHAANAGTDCFDTDAVACLDGVGAGHCAVVLVATLPSPLSFSGSGSDPEIIQPDKRYQSPDLGLVPPPPNNYA